MFVRPVPIVQDVPRYGPRREALRVQGQFWTPDWVADAMVAWVAQDADAMFDPAVGAGAFFRAGKRLSARTGTILSLLGTEVDRGQFEIGLHLGLEPADYSGVSVADFMQHDPGRSFPAIVANPPYIRHHRISFERKAALHAMASQATGQVLDGRAGLHVFFLIRALTLLAPGGRLAFIVPADICEGKSAPALWSWISAHFRIEAAVTFAPAASPFPGVDTNPLILLLRNAPPVATMRWAHVHEAGTADLLAWCQGEFGELSSLGLEAATRPVAEAVRTGLSRRAPGIDSADTVPLGDLFRVMRGIATGENEFFFLRKADIARLGLPMNAFIRAIGRTSDHADAVLEATHLDELDRRGRPTYLLSLKGEPANDMPWRLRAYLRQGEEKGLPKRPLIAQRSPWFRMEQRQPPPWLFTYLGRRSCRFIRNRARAVPLTGFLCVYPAEGQCFDPDVATRVLNDERTLANLALVAKSYGGGGLKVEPRGLERLPIPRAVLDDHKLTLEPMRLL